MSLTYEKVVQEDLNVGTAADVSVTSPDGGTLTGTQIGLHSLAVGQISWTGAWNPDSMAAAGSTSTSLSVPGASVGDLVIASLSTILTDTVMISAHVSADDTVLVVLYNPTASPINLGSGTLRVAVFKSR